MFNWDISTKLHQLSLSDISLELFLIQIVIENQWTPFNKTMYWLVLVFTNAKWAYKVVAPCDNIHSYHRTTVTNDCCAPGLIDCAPCLKYLDTPVYILPSIWSVPSLSSRRTHTFQPHKYEPLKIIKPHISTMLLCYFQQKYNSSVTLCHKKTAIKNTCTAEHYMEGQSGQKRAFIYIIKRFININTSFLDINKSFLNINK